jgi:hypothetical protein
LRKDVDLAQQIENEKKDISDKLSKTWMPSVLKNSNLELKLDLNLLPLLPNDMLKYTAYRQQLNKNKSDVNIYNTESRFQLSKSIDQRQFYSGSIDNVQVDQPKIQTNTKLSSNISNADKKINIGKPILIIMDNSKLTKEDMVC